MAERTMHYANWDALPVYVLCSSRITLNRSTAKLDDVTCKRCWKMLDRGLRHDG